MQALANNNNAPAESISARAEGVGIYIRIPQDVG